MFKLIDLSIGLFAIVKANEEPSDMPIIAHGFIEVSDHISPEPTAILLHGQMSKELAESSEVELLKKEAIELAKEAVADEFSD